MFKNRISCLFIIILSLLLCLSSKLDGVLRTVVITGETSETILVVKPLWESSMATFDVTYRAYVGANAAFHAAIFLHMESLVGNEHVLEESSHYLGEEPRDRTLHQSADTLLAIVYLLACHCQLLCSLLFLANFTLLGIYIHER